MRVLAPARGKEGTVPIPAATAPAFNRRMTAATISARPEARARPGPATAAGETGERAAAGWPVAILGIPFDHVALADAVGRIDAMIATRRPHYVVTANVDFLVQASRDVELRRILLEADLVLCDGTPLVWASRCLGNRLPGRAAGADIVPRLIAAAAANGRRVFFLGAAPGVAAAAAARLRSQYPALQVAGHYAPPFAGLLEMDHEEIVRRVRAARPDVLLVSFGCPKQEKWIAMHHRGLGVPVVIGVGATIDFLAGRVRRAPVWMRQSGTEWIFRLLQEPRRLFRRYADDLLRFLPALAKQAWRLHRRTDPAGLSVPPGACHTYRWLRVEAGRLLTAEALRRHAARWQELRAETRDCLLDLSRVEAIDSTGVALLGRWRQQLNARARRFVVLSPSAAVRDALDRLRLTDHFVIARSVAEAAQQMETFPDGSMIVQPGGSIRSVAWAGEITAANTGEVWDRTVQHLLELGGTREAFPIDLSRLRFIDSTGAALMLRLQRWAEQMELEIHFVGAQANVRNVLELSGLDETLLEAA